MFSTSFLIENYFHFFHYFAFYSKIICATYGSFGGGWSHMWYMPLRCIPDYRIVQMSMAGPGVNGVWGSTPWSLQGVPRGQSPQLIMGWNGSYCWQIGIWLSTRGYHQGTRKIWLRPNKIKFCLGFISRKYMVPQPVLSKFGVSWKTWHFFLGQLR